MLSVNLKIPGREELDLQLEVDAAGVIQKSFLRGVGNRSFLETVNTYRGQLKGRLADLPLPSGNSSAELLLREAILKLRNEWHPVYTEEELCHCRCVPFRVVDAAVVGGAHTPEKVSAWTSASTACGTCRPDVEAHLRFRLTGTK